MFNDALTSARVRPEEVGYVNAHGTGTPLGDPAETQAIRQAFGAHADELAVSSTKSMTGHLFGAAGALEAIASALALRDQVLPPTINLEDPDPACDLDYVPLKSREARFDVAISNSMGLAATMAPSSFAAPAPEERREAVAAPGRPAPSRHGQHRLLARPAQPPDLFLMVGALLLAMLITSPSPPTSGAPPPSSWPPSPAPAS